MADARVTVNLREGSFEIQGDTSFVREQLEKLLPLIRTVKPLNIDASNHTRGSAADRNPSEDSRKARKGVRRAPPGASSRDRILVLKAKGFFKKHRAPAEIVAGLAQEGWTQDGGQVRAALSHMFEGGEIQRTKNTERRGFLYYWDRD